MGGRVSLDRSSVASIVIVVCRPREPTTGLLEPLAKEPDRIVAFMTLRRPLIVMALGEALGGLGHAAPNAPPATLEGAVHDLSMAVLEELLIEVLLSDLRGSHNGHPMLGRHGREAHASRDTRELEKPPAPRLHTWLRPAVLLVLIRG